MSIFPLRVTMIFSNHSDVWICLVYPWLVKLQPLITILSPWDWSLVVRESALVLQTHLFQKTTSSQTWEFQHYIILYFSWIYAQESLSSLVVCFVSGHNMMKDITVVETNYTEYALVLKHQVFNREYTQVALYGKTQKHFYLLHDK